KFNLAIKTADITPAQNQESLMLFAESLLRDHQPAAAAEILQQPNVRNHPNQAFWLGQSLAGQGRFSEAVTILLPIAANPSHPFQAEAAFTASSLQLSLSQPDAAINTLQLLNSSKDSSIATQAKLRRIEILIDQDEYIEARKLFPKQTAISSDLLPLAKFLNGRMKLAENENEAAELVFTDLLANPQGQTLRRYHLAAIGKADALRKLGDTVAATESLLGFLQNNPASPLLDPIFQRIIEWLPETKITADHPTLLRLAGWLPQTSPPGAGLINSAAITASAAWPISGQPPTELEIFSMYARAIGLHRIDNPVAKIEANQLLRKIGLLAPQHTLNQRSLITLASWKLDEGKQEEAFFLFDSIFQTAKSPIIKGEAAFLEAKIAYDRGDTSLAAELFIQAAKLLSDDNQEAAILNAALSRLKENPESAITIQSDNPAMVSKLGADLALEKALAGDDPAAAKFALLAFLTQNPDHIRAPEARLAIIEASLSIIPPDLALARAQIDTLSGKVLPSDLSPQLSLAELRLSDLSNDEEKTIELAKKIIADFPETPGSSEASLILGKTLFQSGSYNEARLVLEKLAVTESGTQRGQAAFLLAARAAALGATDQSREEALALFDKSIAIEGPLKSLAVLEKARLYIDLNRLPLAISSLRKAYKATPLDDPSRIPTGILLAEAIYAQGDSEPGEALTIYNDLIDITPNNSSQYFRIQYLRGLTFEKLPDPKDPAKRRLGEALSTYFSVLDRPTNPPPPEWKWFERSGFRALALLENAERWQAAISVASKIAAFKGPRAEEASLYARQLRLKHMIWED
ncbi:MAG: hypothetical protein H7Y36_10360, partial [Armatimonadetes bacterium]|nr:hypothetical protein [Akkermansiaceae bacterium]